MLHRYKLPFIALMIAAASGCADAEEATDRGLPANTADAVGTYAQIVQASYEDSLETARTLQAAVEAFVAQPSGETLSAARQAWLGSREPYLQTEVYRFYEGPIDNAADGPEGLINAWPLDELYIDYGAADPEAGLINDPSQTIDGEELESLNEQGGEKNIATGYHAIEFLLWGQDQSDSGPGDRPYTDYLEGDEATAPNGDRRGQYLLTVTELLVGHLEDLVKAWAADEDNYRRSFENVGDEEALTRILTGMIVLSGFETGGERLQTAYDSSDQEDEHSCFSDNTHRDMVQDVRGVQNVWLGQYERTDGDRVEGVAIRDVVRAHDVGLADELDTAIQQSLADAEALEPPFDREIQADNAAGRRRVQRLITSLRAQEDLLEKVFHAFQLSVPADP